MNETIKVKQYGILKGMFAPDTEQLLAIAKESTKQEQLKLIREICEFIDISQPQKKSGDD